MNRVCSSVQKCVLPLGLFVCLFVCLFLPGRCVYKLHYSKVKDKRREKRMHIHTHTRAQIMGYSQNALPFSCIKLFKYFFAVDFQICVNIHKSKSSQSL